MDIKSEGFEADGMHYGATGAMHDTPTEASGTKMKEMMNAAPTSFSGVGAGQQSPRSA